MAYELARLQATVSADTSEFNKELANAEKTIKAFAKSSTDSADEVHDGLKKLADAGQITEEQFKDMQKRMSESKAMRDAAKLLKGLARDANMSSKEIAELGKQMGVTEKTMRHFTNSGLFGNGLLGQGLRSFSTGLLSSMIPTTAIATAISGAVGSAMYAIWNQETDFQKQAKKHGLDVDNLQSQYEQLSASILKAAQSTEVITEAQRKSHQRASASILQSYRQEADKLLKDFDEIGKSYEHFSLGVDAGWSMRGQRVFATDEVQSLSVRLKELKADARAGKIEFSELAVSVSEGRKKLEEMAKGRGWLNQESKDAKELVEAYKVVEATAHRYHELQEKIREATSKATASISSWYDQISLSPDDLKLKQLTGELENYRFAAELAKESTAAWKLEVLAAGAEAGGFGSLGDLAKEQSKLFERIKVLEEGDINLRKSSNKIKFDLMKNALGAERESLRGMIEVIKARVAARSKGATQEIGIMRALAVASGAVDQMNIDQFDKQVATIDKALAALDKYGPDKVFGSLGGGKGKGGKGGGAPVERVAYQLSEAYNKAAAATEQLSLKQAELMAQLKGSGLQVELEKIASSYSAQMRSIEKEMSALDDKVREWEKKGKLTEESRKSVADARTELKNQKELVEQNRALNEQLERRNELLRQLDTQKEYAGLVGNTILLHDAEVKRLGMLLGCAVSLLL